jgi:lipopolysaccharide export system permease protein
MILFFYVAREFVKYVVGTLILCMFLFILFDFIHKTTGYLARYQPKSTDLIQFYLYQMPQLAQQALPITALIASVICMVLLSRTNEITAMRAAGMGPISVGMPIAVGGLIISGFSLILDQFIIPRTAEKVHYIEEVLMEKQEDTRISERARWLRDKDRLIRARELIEADSAKYSPDEKIWVMGSSRAWQFAVNGVVQHFERRPPQVVSIPIEPAKLKKERRKPSELSYRELWDYIKRGESSGMDVSVYRIEFHVKLAFCFAAFVVSLIGLKFGYRSERSMETVRSVLLAFAVGISYWFILNAARAFARNGILNPVFAAWAANFIVLSVALVGIWRARKD